MFGVMAPVGMNEARELSVPGLAVSSKSTSVSGTANMKQGGNKLMSKLFGGIASSATSKDTSIDEQKQSEEQQQSEGYQQPDETKADEPLLDLITPCPFIRPLEHKLQARTEPTPKLKSKPRSIDTFSTNSSALAIAMNREETHRILNGRFEAENMEESFANLSNSDNIAVDSVMESDTAPSTTVTHEEIEAEDDMEVQISRQLEYVSVTAARGSEAVHHWRYYLECYSKGQFNLNAPPPPPPRSSIFEYLPAIFPPQEEKRMSVGSSYDVVWPRWSRDKASALICAAMKEFDAYFASLSFFDGKHEVFKAENGYNVSRISRSISIAAHALLSEDVLVILDTKQDWRFEGNPLVCHNPNIRFFAAAPMLSSDGQPVGVFAIFSKEPRDAFNAAQRRELAGYSAMALTDLTQQAKWLSDFELHSPRSTPLLQRDSRINGDYRPATVKAPKHVEIDHALVPSCLRYHKEKTPPSNTTRVFLNRHLSLDAPFEQTPPSSSEGSEDDSPPRYPRGFGKNHKELAVNADLSRYASPGDMITPDSEDFHVSTPRPFSASDLTSLNPHPPNTPVLTGQEVPINANADLTVENFMSLSDTDCAEQESPLIDLSTPGSEPSESKIGGGQSFALPPRFTMSSISTMMTGDSQKCKDPLAEAAFSCSFAAQNLGYDLIYIVKIKPLKPFMTDQELFAPGGIHKRIVVAYGLDRPMELATDMHIKVLRSRGFQIWENRDATYENDEFQTGYLLPLPTETGPRRQRCSGLVFGAFRRAKVGDIGPPVHITAQQMKKLMDAAHTLRDILLKQPSTRRLPKRSNTEPAAQERYPANEAVEVQVGRYSATKAGQSPPTPVEVRKHLLDETPERYPANEAIEVQMENFVPDKPGRLPPNPYLANEAIAVERHHFDEAPYQYPAREGRQLSEDALEPHSSRETAETEKFSDNSGLGTSEPASPERKSAREAAKVKKTGKSEPTSPERKKSRETARSKKAGKSEPTSPDRKVLKESKRAAKAEKAAKIPLDAGMERPFHAISRFRPF